MEILSFSTSLRNVRRNARVVHRHDDHDFDLIDEDLFLPKPEYKETVHPLRRGRRLYTPEEIALGLDRDTLSAIDIQELRRRLASLLKSVKPKRVEHLNDFNLHFIPT